MLVLLTLLACGPKPLPPPDIRIGVTLTRGADISAFEDALSGVNAEVVRLIERAPAAAMVTLDSVDALLLGPGMDIDPALYGELPHETHVPVPQSRQDMDLSLAREALRRDMPVLGVCLGAQELAVAMGGSLVQDVPTEVSLAEDHRGAHEIRPVEGSLMADLYGESARVRSNHHQAVDHPGAHAVVAARSADGSVEAVVAPDHLFVAGVQFHPEEVGEGLTTQTPLWTAFAEAARTYKDRGEKAVTYTEPGTPAPEFHVCETVRAPFPGEVRRDLEALSARKVGSFGDYRRSFVKGHKHGGTDLTGGFSEDVVAICEGKVTDMHLGFPHRTVVVEHIRPDGEQIYSSYKHIEDISVAVGDLVGPNTRIGRLFTEEEYGRSPFSSNHLHFEMRTSIDDGGSASWTSMTMEALEAFAFDPWAFFAEELGDAK